MADDDERLAPPVACECEADGPPGVCGCCAVRFDVPGERDCECCRDRIGWRLSDGPPQTSAPGRRRNGNAYSTVFTVRIGHREWREVCRRAQELGMGPSVWVRALVRTELGHTYDW